MNPITRHVIFLSLCAAFLFTAFHMAFTFGFPSMFNGEMPELLNPTAWVKDIYLYSTIYTHESLSEFARRPVTTASLRMLSDLLNLSAPVALVVVEYIFFFIGMALFYLLSFRFSSTVAAWLSCAVFVTSFSVLLGFFNKIYAFDEPAQYMFLFAALLALTYDRLYLFSLFFFCCLVTRESGLLLYPALFLFMIWKPGAKFAHNVRRTVLSSWCIPFYAAFVALIIGGDEKLAESSGEYMFEYRFKHLFYSFQDLPRSMDTITSFVAVFLVPFAFLFSMRYESFLPKNWYRAFWFALILNTIITLFFTLGREARIFAQPLVLLWPFLGFVLIKAVERIRKNPIVNLLHWDGILAYGAFLVMVFFWYMFSFHVYFPIDTSFYSGFQYSLYLSGVVAFLVVFLEFLIWRGKTTVRNKPVRVKWLVVAMLIVPFVGLTGSNTVYRAIVEYAPFINQKELLNEASAVLVSTEDPNVPRAYFAKKGELENVNFSDLSNKYWFKHSLEWLYSTPHDSVVYIEKQSNLALPIEALVGFQSKANTISYYRWRGLSGAWNDSTLVYPTCYIYNSDSGNFIKGQQNMPFNGHSFNFSEEFGPGFKMKLGDILDSSFVSAGFIMEFHLETLSSQFITISLTNRHGETTHWKAYPLETFFIKQGWNTAAILLNTTETDPEAVLACYVWNNDRKPIEVRNARVYINAPWANKWTGYEI